MPRQQHEEDAGQRIEPDVEWQVWQPDQQRGPLGRHAEAGRGHDCEHGAGERPERKEDPADVGDAAGSEQPGGADHEPAR